MANGEDNNNLWPAVIVACVVLFVIGVLLTVMVLTA